MLRKLHRSTEAVRKHSQLADPNRPKGYSIARTSCPVYKMGRVAQEPPTVHHWFLLGFILPFSLLLLYFTWFQLLSCSYLNLWVFLILVPIPLQKGVCGCVRETLLLAEVKPQQLCRDGSTPAHQWVWQSISGPSFAFLSQGSRKLDWGSCVEELYSIPVRRTKELQKIREWLHGKRECSLKAWLLERGGGSCWSCTQNLAFPTFLMHFEYIQAWRSCGRDLNFFSFFLLSLWMEHINLLQSNGTGSFQG